MAQTTDVRVPDIGDFTDVPVIEILVKPGDAVKKNDSIITLESEKASMEVPSPVEGTVQDVKVKVGDKVSEGSVLLTVAAEEEASTAASIAEPPSAEHPGQLPRIPQADTAQSDMVELKVPDIGDFKDVPVIEVLVK